MQVGGRVAMCVFESKDATWQALQEVHIELWGPAVMPAVVALPNSSMVTCPIFEVAYCG